MNPPPQQSQTHSSYPLDMPNKLQRSCSLSANTMRTCQAKHNQSQLIMPPQMSMIPCKRGESQRFMQYNTLPLRMNTPLQLPISSLVLFSSSVLASTNQHKPPACITTPRSTAQGTAFGQEPVTLVPMCIGMKSASPLRLACSSSSTIAVNSSQCSFKDYGEFRDRSTSQIQFDMSASSSNSSSTYSLQSFQRIVPQAQQQSQALSQQQQSQLLNNHSTPLQSPRSALNATQFQSASARALMDTFQKHKDLVQKQSRSSSSYSSSSSSSSTPSQQLSDNRTLSIRNDLSPSSSTFSLQALTSIPPGCCALAKISSRQVISHEEKLRIASFAKKGSLDGEYSQIKITPKKADSFCVHAYENVQPEESNTLREQQEQQQELRCLQTTQLHSKSNHKEHITTTAQEIQLNIIKKDEGQIPKRSATNSSKRTRKQEAQPLRQPSSDSEKLPDHQEDNKSNSKIIQYAQDDHESRDNQETQKHTSQQDQSQQQEQESAYAITQQHSQPQSLSNDSQVQHQPSMIQPEIISEDQRISPLVEQYPNDTQMQHYDCQYYDMDIRTNTEEYCIAEQTNTDRDCIEDKEEFKYTLLPYSSSQSTDSPNEQHITITSEELLAEKYSNNKSDFKIDEQTEEESIVSDEYLTLSPCLQVNKQPFSQQSQHQTPSQLSLCQGGQATKDIDHHHPHLLPSQTTQQESSMLSSDQTPVDKIHHHLPKNCNDASTSPIRAILSADIINHNNINHSHDTEDSSHLLADSEILINGQSALRLQEQEERKLEDDYQQRKRQIQGEIKTKQKQRKQSQQHLAVNPERIKNIPCSSSNNSNTSNSNSCTAASSKGDTFSITDASISQSMQMIALQKREEILDRIKHIDAQLLVHQQQQQQAQLAKSKTHKGKPCNILISKNPPKSADRADNQPLVVSSVNNQPTPQKTSTFRHSPCPLSHKSPVVPQLRASTPSARTSAQSFPAKRSADSAKSLSKQNSVNFLDESGGLKACNSSKKLTGFIILTDQQIHRTPKWENMQAQKNLWNKGQRRDLKFTDESSTSHKVDSNNKENQQAGMIATTTATKNSGTVQNKAQRSSSIKPTSSSNKQSAPLGVINLFELQNKPKEDPQIPALTTSKNLNMYPLTATLTPRQSSTRQYHPLHQPFFKNATPSYKSKLDCKMTSVFGKKQSSSKISIKKTPNIISNTNPSANFQKINAFQPATFSIIPIVQEIDLEAEHAIKMSSQEYQGQINSLSHLHNSKDYLNFNTYSPSKHSNERLTRHHRYQICEGAKGFDEEFSPIAQRTKGEEDMSDISGLNPSSNETRSEQEEQK